MLICHEILNRIIRVARFRRMVCPVADVAVLLTESEQVMQIAAAARKHEAILLKFIYLNLRTQILVI